MENNIIEQLAEAHNPGGLISQDVIDILTALEPFIPKWVDVEDALPEEGQPVLVQIPNALIQPSHFENGKFNRFRNNTVNDRTTAYYYEPVTHWMPLPSTTHPFEQLYNHLLNSK